MCRIENLPPPERKCYCGAEEKLTRCGATYICLACCSKKKCFSYEVCPRKRADKLSGYPRSRAVDWKTYKAFEARKDEYDIEPAETATQMTIENLSEVQNG